MFEREKEKKSDIVETVKRELQRRSLDQIRVYNPLSEPFQTNYDGLVHVVPAKSEYVTYRYIAEKWMRELVTHMINTDIQATVDKENINRLKRGWKVMDTEERIKFDSINNLYTSDPEIRMKNMLIIYKGIDREYGLDMPDKVAVKKRDRRPLDRQLLDKLDSERGLSNAMSTPDGRKQSTSRSEDEIDSLAISEDSLESTKDAFLKGISDERKTGKIAESEKRKG